MSSWVAWTLGELETASSGTIQTGPFGSQLHQSDYAEVGTPVVMPTNIRELRVDDSGIARVSQEHVERLARHKLAPGDIVYSRRGDVEKCALVAEQQEGWLCGTGCLIVRVHGRIADPRFLAYQLSLPQTKEWISQRAVGATMPNLNTRILREVPVHLPSLEEQRAIAATLGALDDKIESNFRNTILLDNLVLSHFARERSAAELCTKCLDEVFDIRIGHTPPRKESHWFSTLPIGTMWASIKDMAGATPFLLDTAESLTDDAIEKHRIGIAEANDILVSFKLTVGRVSIAATPICTNEAIATLHPSDKYLRAWAYAYLRSFEFGSLGNTSSIATATNSSAIKAMPIEIPEVTRLQNFSQANDPLLDLALYLQCESRRLAHLRDTLLPELMSGRIRVREAEEAVAEVTADA